MKEKLDETVDTSVPVAVSGDSGVTLRTTVAADEPEGRAVIAVRKSKTDNYDYADAESLGLQVGEVVETKKIDGRDDLISVFVKGAWVPVSVDPGDGTRVVVTKTDK